MMIYFYQYNKKDIATVIAVQIPYRHQRNMPVENKENIPSSNLA